MRRDAAMRGIVLAVSVAIAIIAAIVIAGWL
jgi:hypothetical protein